MKNTVRNIVLMACRVCLATFSMGAVSAANIVRADEPTGKVAVFSQAEFPFYNVSSLISPSDIVGNLRAVGVTAEALDAAALSDRARFNARNYSALILPYGNTYPQIAFASMQAFHRAGGSLVMSGVPFTHPVAQLGAQGWSVHPNWGNAVRVLGIDDARAGKSVLQLSGPDSDWVGVHSARQSILANDAIVVSAQTRTLSGEDGGRDFLYVRFYDAGGSFLSQEGARISSGADWHLVQASLVAPAAAASCDVAPQVSTAKRVLQLDEVALSVGGRASKLENAGFETAGRAWTDLGHLNGASGFGPDGIGVGGFKDSPQGTVSTAPGDPLGLKTWHRRWQADSDLQSIDTPNLPKYVTVQPAMLEGKFPISALLKHGGGSFVGAVDVWTNHSSSGDLDAYDSEHLLVRGAIASLHARKLIGTPKRDAAFAKLAKLPRPRVWENVRLPIVPRPYQTFQPKMPLPARQLHVADMRNLSPDERLLLVSLQGLVNRKQPRIYLIFNNDDEWWLKQLQAQKHIDVPVRVTDPMSLIDKFRSEFRGAVVPDENMALSANIAVSISGLDNLLVATPKLAARYGLAFKRDLRGRFTSNAQMLRFLRTDLLPRANKYLAICLDAPLLGNGAMDQIIAAKGLSFWISGPKQQHLPGANMRAELEEIKALFAAMPLNAVVRGFWWHGDGVGLEESFGVALGSRFGKVTSVSDYVQNFSVFSGLPSPKLLQKFAPPPPFDPNKVYIAFTMSDGDNLSTWPGYFRQYFQDPLHGTIPVGWGIAPNLSELAPNVAQWFYDRATPNDEFICDVSGVAYIYPPDWGSALANRDEAFRAFYKETGRAMRDMDLRTIRLMNVRTQDIPQVAKQLPDVRFLVPDYGFSGPQTLDEFTYTLPSGQSVFRAALEGQGQGPREKADILRRRVGSARPAFMNAFIWNWGSKLSDLKQMLEILGPQYVAVTPSQLDSLYRQHRAQSAQMQKP